MVVTLKVQINITGCSNKDMDTKTTVKEMSSTHQDTATRDLDANDTHAINVLHKHSNDHGSVVIAGICASYHQQEASRACRV
ncbi:predicted protein [Lichtheimia corymbifera JMRC:FSU:9682]|uniref:Uncharacterized protein n=1 Tax=Lichtheimia corymbifera JMRC:FSU:9682 TaxID=1263082 RepID=A0A068RIK7_9FUNG|nr:predicted protein [Lichtheimia corymbifera JMRC:FSU:9682]